MIMTMPRTRIPDPSGMTFGRLTVIRLDGHYPKAPGATRSINGDRAVWCACTCGYEGRFRWAPIRKGHTKSCGCISREKAAERARERNVKSKPAQKHGMKSSDPALNNAQNYQRAKDAIRRCHDPKSRSYANYGWRGIQVHEPWRQDPLLFVRWMGEVLGPCPPGHTLDRIDNNGNYEPGNLRWADWPTQVANQRRHQGG